MNRFLIPLMLLLFIGCKNHVDSRVNEKIVLDVLNEFVTSVENKDYAKIDQLTHDDFVIYENGSVWNLERFSQALEGYDSVKISYTLEDIHSIVDHNTAHLQFINKGMFTHPDTVVNLQFIESATLVRENDIWLIKFYHSTHLK
ncbi:MAG: nuclear transport factor 2 family protein [Salinivirgaceae bacterium]|nr:nuclear transport factor 2 family protein [Salinivirgaceae bacterium]